MNDWTGKSGYLAAGLIAGLAKLTPDLTPDQWYMIIAVALGMGTFVVNWYYKQQTKVHQDKIRDIERKRENKEDE